MITIDSLEYNFNTIVLWDERKRVKMTFIVLIIIIIIITIIIISLTLMMGGDSGSSE